jgi:hypothetical protein
MRMHSNGLDTIEWNGIKGNRTELIGMGWNRMA